MYAKLQVGCMYNKRDIHIQKIKVEKLIFRYIIHYIRDLAVYFHKRYTICKISDSGLNDLNYMFDTKMIILEQTFYCNHCTSRQITQNQYKKSETVPSAIMFSMCMQNFKLVACIIREISIDVYIGLHRFYT